MLRAIGHRTADGRQPEEASSERVMLLPFSRGRIVYYDGVLSGPIVSVNEEQEAPMAIEASISKRALAAFGPGAEALER